MLRVLANTKGGEGKTTLAAHVLSWLIYKGKKINVVEIDNNNVSSIFSNSEIINSKSITTAQKELRVALAEASFDPAQEYIIDAGGGDDSLAVIHEIIAMEIETEFYIPFRADHKTLHNVQKTVEAIGGGCKKHLVLNGFASDPKEEYWFIYGDEERGFEPNLKIFKQFDSVIFVPNSKTIGQAEAFQLTVGDVALQQKRVDFTAAKAEARAKGFEAYSSVLNAHARGVAAMDFLDSIKIEKRK